ncbi:PREDICTED: uncharacterized protein LOC108364356 [Rhagoletis zephyria]|uniref:uncharacterized protein LOC108364356 n=1 Tax=Rhagoletis zephyria TaxID=28612 RepID=UPI0008112198|nr:PREDICTED: uncharacterized protein LOC108364356 [Rhagoletis zephyria]XP_017473497.1 PREDICTED: uncharacterized protein LOC108364356 [Rhagoletis zephyria]
MDVLTQILNMNAGGAYGGGKAGGAFDPLTFAMKPQVVIRALCWVLEIIFMNLKVLTPPNRSKRKKKKIITKSQFKSIQFLISNFVPLRFQINACLFVTGQLSLLTSSSIRPHKDM